MPQLTPEGAQQRKSAAPPADPVANGNGHLSTPAVIGHKPAATPRRVPTALESEWQAWLGSATTADHPLGAPRHGRVVSSMRTLAFALYFFGSCLFIHAAQLLGAPLYFVSRRAFDAWVAHTKRLFGLLVTTMTQWWSPTTVRVSGDASMAGCLAQDSAGMLLLRFDRRVVLMANHQLYTDWLYLWWAAYAHDNPPMHGAVYIILKQSLQYVPLLGPAMMFYGFIFMARKWATDRARLHHRLCRLARPPLGPMWLLIFPEGTNISANTRHKSAEYCAKTGLADMRHQLLPRSTGLQYCLQELGDTVEYLYDCTIAYEGIPPGLYGQDVFSLRSVYFQGCPPKSVNMHWRRFRVADLPLADHDAMYDWLLARWREKDELLEQFYQHGKFPADPVAVSIEGGPTEKEFKTAYINTEVKPRAWWEFLQMYVPVLGAAVVGSALVRAIDWATGKA